MSLIVAIACVVLIAPNVTADSTLCTGYSFSTCINAGYIAHGFENHYTNSYWKAYGGHNCTNYVGYMLAQNGDIGPGAAIGVAGQWDDMIAANPQWGYTANTTPARGSIALWGGNPGHVAYVEEVTNATTIKISEDNYSAGPFSWRIINTSGDWPDEFLHIRDVADVSHRPFAVAKSDGSFNILGITADGHFQQQVWSPSGGWTGWIDKGTTGGGF